MLILKVNIVLFRTLLSLVLVDDDSAFTTKLSDRKESMVVYINSTGQMKSKIGSIWANVNLKFYG